MSDLVGRELIPHVRVFKRGCRGYKKFSFLFCNETFYLSRTQREVLGFILEGYSIFQISGKIFTTEKNVKYHISNLMKILRVRSRFELVAFYYTKKRKNDGDC